MPPVNQEHNTITNDPLNTSLHGLHAPGYIVADATARAAITTMLEGDVCYQSDTKQYFFWSGVAWVNFMSNSPTGEILFKNSNYACVGTENGVVVDASGGLALITLPPSPTVNQEVFIVKPDSTSNAVGVIGFGTNTINGLSGQYSYINSQYGYAVFNYDGAGNWNILGNSIDNQATFSQSVAQGLYSHAEGQGTTASGISSHSEGRNTVASGLRAHAEGDTTTASNTSAHSEGVSTIASGLHAHAEGNTTQATMDSSHAEGAATIANNLASHAEGLSTTASGQYSHSEGSSTTASGVVSHAEGGSTVASGNASHAEGSSSVSSGDNSHAEGNSTVSLGAASHAEGQGTHANGANSHAGGTGSIADNGNCFAHGDTAHASHINTALFSGSGGDITTKPEQFVISYAAGLALKSHQTSTAGTSGSITSEMPLQGTRKKFCAYLSSFVSVAGVLITFPEPFVRTPFMYGDSSATSITVVNSVEIIVTTASPVSGYIFLEGF